MPKKIEPIKVPDEPSVDMSIHVGPYLQAYLRYKNTLDNRDSDEYLLRVAKGVCLQMKQEIVAQLDGFKPELLWTDAIDRAMDGNAFEIDEINNSAVAQIVKDGFVELIFNAIDETLQQHLDDPNPLNVYANLRMTVDNTTNPDCVSIRFSDNGRGFKPNMLALSSAEARKDYIFSRGSHKSAEFDSIRQEHIVPLNFGGRGMGLRQIMLKMDEGAHLEPDGRHMHYYQPPEKSSIVLDNRLNRKNGIEGASITFTTSTSPLIDLNHTDSEELSTDWEFSLPSAQPSKDSHDKVDRTAKVSSSLTIDTDVMTDEEDDYERYRGNSPG